MRAFRLARSESARRLALAGVLAALAIVASARLAAQDAKPGSGPMSLDELNRDVRPRIRALAEAVLAEQKTRDETEAREVGPRVEIGGSQAERASAGLLREIADLALKEYKESTAKLERVRLEAEIRIAEAAVRGAEVDLDEVGEIVLKSREMKPASIPVAANDFDVDALLQMTKLSLDKEKLNLEQAKGLLVVFDEYHKVKRVNELQAEVAKARFIEAARVQSLELKQSDAARREPAVRRFKERVEPKWTPVVKALDDVVGLEAELRSRFSGKPTGESKEVESPEKGITELSNRLRAALERVEQRCDDIIIEALGRSLRGEARPARDSSPTKTTATPRVAAQDGPPRMALITLDDLNREIRPRIRKLALAALDGRHSDSAVPVEPSNKRIDLQAMEAVYEQAKLAHEVAEIAVKEYTEGFALQKRREIEAEVGGVETLLSDAKERVSRFEAFFEKFKAFKPTQIRVMARGYEHRRSYRAGQLEVSRCQLALEQAQGKLKNFNEYEVPRRTKEKLAEVEEARAEEQKAEERFKTATAFREQWKKQVEVGKNRKKPDWAPVLSSLSEAVGSERTLRSQLGKSPPADADARRVWEATLSAQSTNLRAALERAEQLSEDIEFEELGRKVRELVQSMPPAVTAEPQK